MKAIWLFTLIGLFMVTHRAIAQEQTGHGGDPVGIEVAAIISDIFSQADQSPEFQSCLLKRDYAEFKAALADVPIQPVKKLKLNGREVAMMNYSDPARILVARRAWARMESYSERKTLVLHEIFGATDEEPSETYHLTNACLPYVRCGIYPDVHGLSAGAKTAFFDLLSKRGYRLVPVRSDYELLSVGNLLWIKDHDHRVIWSGEWHENEPGDQQFTPIESLPTCGGTE